jgi:hypothetical protein
MEPYFAPLKPLLIAEPQGYLGGVDLCGPLDPSQVDWAFNEGFRPASAGLVDRGLGRSQTDHGMA